MNKLIEVINQKGVSYLFQKTLQKVTNKKVPGFAAVQSAVSNKSGIEIGGPSRIFGAKGFIPIYPFVQRLDGCNFSTSTLWEGTISSGKYEYHAGKEGKQYISEASDLNLIPNGDYDFVISCHCLEHVANPIKAVKEWMRITKNGGHLLLVLPNKKFNFDHRRADTPFEHLLEDFEKETTEEDLTHLTEILKYHDLSRDKLAGNAENFKARSLRNFENRALHQHVFSLKSLEQVYNYCGLKTIFTYAETDNLIIFGQKPSA